MDLEVEADNIEALMAMLDSPEMRITSKAYMWSVLCGVSTHA